jgi:hypothetical protein
MVLNHRDKMNRYYKMRKTTKKRTNKKKGGMYSQRNSRHSMIDQDGKLDRNRKRNREFDERAFQKRLRQTRVSPSDEYFDKEIAYFYKKLMDEKNKGIITKEYAENMLNDLLDSQYDELTENERTEIMTTLRHWYKIEGKYKHL